MSHHHPEATQEIHVLARHPHWSGTLCFDEAAGRARLAANNAHASYSTVSGGILLFWDDFPAERFLALDGRLIHAALVHPASKADAAPGASTDILERAGDPAHETVLVRAPGTDMVIALRWPGCDCKGFEEIFQRRTLDIPGLPPTASTVVDIGAGIGLASLFFAHRYADATICSVEADVADHALLLRNMAQVGRRGVVAGAGCGGTHADSLWSAAGDAVSALMHRPGSGRIDLLRIGYKALDARSLGAAGLDWLDAVDAVVLDGVAPGATGRDDVARLLQDRGFSASRRGSAAEAFVRPAAGHVGAFAVGRSRRTIVVTPYFKESADTLRRCVESVLGQNQRTEHLLVADGHPQSWLDGLPVRHLRLDRSHGDYGNTPRGIGATMAISEDYDAIAFLDADNWLEADHVERCHAAADASTDVDYVVAQWTLRRPDGTVIRMASQPGHVDTNCFFLLPGSYHLIPHFSMMPRQLSPVGDRVFYAAVQAAGMKAAETDRATVNYTCLWSSAYQAIGEEPPPGAKPNIDSASIGAWLRARTPRALDIVGRRAGVRVG